MKDKESFELTVSALVRSNRYVALALAIISLFLMFSFAWVNYPVTTTQSLNFTYSGSQLSNASITSTLSMNTGQTTLAVSAFTVFEYLAYGIAIALVAFTIVEWVSKWLKKRGELNANRQKGVYE